ncbi:CAP domain-containing protein [Vibrio sp. vnigr-6D03]|uniref:CAP domain-containing protein n=1 Tax=Vibrio sp. vnigr-6D03 TaxID=2058088 RepID=UPI000C32B617|nr:CAP domain-containing protein [Vibrio sp. vnigr-6D03]PKF79926.1 CAP domain-containing protein [Vibrio sp. vnigr-6D03]
MLYGVKTGTLLAISLSVLAGCGSDNSSSTLTGGQTTNPPTTQPPTTQPPTTKPTKPPIEQEAFAKEMLEVINEYRASSQVCGGRSMPAVAPLTWNTQLTEAAHIHSSNMANYDFFDHDGLDGKQPADRAKDAGYAGNYVGENISAGRTNIHDVMAGWMSSKGHCENIMRAGFKEVGAAVVENSDAEYRYYWTQVFGAAK